MVPTVTARAAERNWRRAARSHSAGPSQARPHPPPAEDADDRPDPGRPAHAIDPGIPRPGRAARPHPRAGGAGARAAGGARAARQRGAPAPDDRRGGGGDLGARPGGGPLSPGPARAGAVRPSRRDADRRVHRAHPPGRRRPPEGRDRGGAGPRPPRGRIHRVPRGAPGRRGALAAGAGARGVHRGRRRRAAGARAGHGAGRNRAPRGRDRAAPERRALPHPV